MFKTEAESSSSAGPAQVWAVLMDVPNWPRWNPGCVAAEAEGPLGLGRRGVVTLVDGRHSPFEVFEWDEMRVMTIGGRGPATDIRSQYRLEDDGAGGTRITLGHTLEGILSPLFARLFQRRVAGYLPSAAAQLARMAGLLNRKRGHPVAAPDWLAVRLGCHLKGMGASTIDQRFWTFGECCCNQSASAGFFFVW